MKPSLFQPRQFIIPHSLVLIPYFSQSSVFTALQKKALRRQDFLHSSLLWFENMAVISGFIGYPHLLTLLQMIAGLADKEIYFLGSAGAIGSRFKEPTTLQVSKIYSSSIYKRFSKKSNFPLQVFPAGSFPSGNGIVSFALVFAKTLSCPGRAQRPGRALGHSPLFQKTNFSTRI
jgi:hypothetical protein